MKKTILIIFLICFCSVVFADSITNYTVSPNVRLNEKVTVFGNYNDPDVNSYVLCKFLVSDSNNVYIDRWTDEYTFSDGSFYAEKVLIEPPYYRGDTFTINTSCGEASVDGNFLVEQPTSLAHPVQKTWEYAFSESNQDAIFILITFICLVIILVGGFIFILKWKVV